MHKLLAVGLYILVIASTKPIADSSPSVSAEEALADARSKYAIGLDKLGADIIALDECARTAGIDHRIDCRDSYTLLRFAIFHSFFFISVCVIHFLLFFRIFIEFISFFYFFAFVLSFFFYIFHSIRYCISTFWNSSFFICFIIHFYCAFFSHLDLFV